MPLSTFSMKDILGGMDGFTGADIEAVVEKQHSLQCVLERKRSQRSL